MSGVERGGRSRADDAQRGGTATALSEDSSSLSPASRVLAIADKVADEDEQMANGVVDSEEADSDDSIGPGSISRRRGTVVRGYVQERRGKHKQSSVRYAAVGDLPRSPTESQASSNESWRRALSLDGKGSPRSTAGKHDHDHGSGRAAVEEGGVLQGASETAEMSGDVAEAVETMNVTGLKAKAAELGISTGGRKTQLKARIKQKLSSSSRFSTSSSIAGRTAMGASDREAGNDAISGPGSAGDSYAGAATLCRDPSITAVPSNRPGFGDGRDGNGESVPAQQPTKSDGSALPEESDIHDLPPSERSATLAVEKDPDVDVADRAATLEESSPRLVSERAGGLPAPASASATPVEVVEVTASSPQELELEATAVYPVDEMEWKPEGHVLHDPTTKRPAAEEFQGEDNDEEGGGVEVEQVGVVLSRQGLGDEMVETGAEHIDWEEVEEDGQHNPGQERLDTQEEQEKDEERPVGRISDALDVDSPAVLAEAAAAAAADARACARGEVFPAELFSPGSDVARGVAGTPPAAELSAEEGGAVGAEEGERGGQRREEILAVPSAQDLNDKLAQVARLWAPVLPKPAPNGADRADPGVSPDILPETEAFKAKIKVLSAWFHQGARTIAPTVAASTSSKQTVHGGDRSAWTAAGAGQAQHAVSAGATARRGGGAKAKATGVGRRTGADSAARKVAGRGVGADDGGSISTAKAGRPAVPKVRSRRGSSSLSTPGGIRTSGAGTNGRLGKPRAQRLSVSPPRTKLSASAAAAARISAASSNAAALAADARAGERRARPASRKIAKVPPTPAVAAVAPSSLRKRNPLIRGSSPPRPSRASNSGAAAAAERGGAGVAGVQGVAKRLVSVAGKSTEGSATVVAGRGTGTPSGQSAVGTPARIARLRSRKTSLVPGSGLSKTSTAPAPASKALPSKKKTGFFSSATSQATSMQEGDVGVVPAGDVCTPTAKGGTPTNVGATGSGSRSALQVFGFDPAVSTPPHTREVP